MRRTFALIFVFVLSISVFYLILRASASTREATGDVPADTMCLASRIGLPCADPQ